MKEVIKNNKAVEWFNSLSQTEKLDLARNDDKYNLTIAGTEYRVALDGAMVVPSESRFVLYRHNPHSEYDFDLACCPVKAEGIIISGTGEIHGRGSCRYKWVSRLSKNERSHVHNGGTVLIRDEDAHHHTQSGWKQVTFWNGKYGHREATPEQVKAVGEIK